MLVSSLPAFSPFPTMFSTLSKPNFNSSFTFILSSANVLTSEQFKILSFGKELNFECHRHFATLNVKIVVLSSLGTKYNSAYLDG